MAKYTREELKVMILKMFHSYLHPISIPTLARNLGMMPSYLREAIEELKEEKLIKSGLKSKYELTLNGKLKIRGMLK